MENKTRQTQPAALPGAAKLPSIQALLLGLIPFIATCFTVPLWDRIHPRIAGLPFNIFWLILGTLLTPLCMWAAYRFEKRSTQADRDAGRQDQQ